MTHKNDIDTNIIMFTKVFMSGCAFICRGNIPVLSQIFLPTLYNTCIQKWEVCAVCVFSSPDKTEETKYRNMFQHLVECCTY